MRSSVRPFLLACLAIPVAACGGGSGGGTPTPTPTPTVTQTPVIITIGARSSLSGEITSFGGVKEPPQTLFAGDGFDIRVFLTFLTGNLSSEDIQTAAIRIAPMEWRRDPTQAPIGGFVAEHVDVGASLDAFDWSAPAIGVTSPAGPAVIPGLAEAGAFYLDVTASLKAHAAAGASSVTYRIRIAGVDDADGFPDVMGLVVADPLLPAFNPVLEIIALR